MENRKVRLLLSCGACCEHYVAALQALGAEPTALYLPKVDTDYDGLLLCGGGDIAPQYYQESIDGSVNIDHKRDEAEFALLKAYVAAGKPVLGICRGHQLINVFFGGSLEQDIPEKDLHQRKDGSDRVHRVTAVSDSALYQLYGESFFVNSAHHQVVKRLGEGLFATAYWNGQYVEAFEHHSYPILGVQWHPERICFANQRKDTVCGADILAYFIELCKAHRQEN